MASPLERWILSVTVCLRYFIFIGSVKANGVILNDLVRSSESSYSLIAWAFSLQNGIAYIVSPLLYFILDKVGHRQLCVIGGILSGFGYVISGFYMDKVLQIFAGFLTSGVGFGFSSLTSFIVLQSYFTNEELPLVLSVMVTFDFVGVALLPPLLQFLLDQYGLRNAMFLFGAVVWHNVLCGVAIRNANPKNKSKDSLTEDVPQEGLVAVFKVFVKEVTSCLLHQKKFLIVLTIEIIGYYTFVSWALFLVTLGKKAGLTGDQAVLLSTAGGVGGLIGRILAIVAFRMDWVNAITSSLLPLLITALTFFAISLTGDFLLLLILVSVGGVSQSFNSSCMFSLLPVSLPRNLYKTALTLELFCAGIAMQSSGFCSGLISDLTGSPAYVYQSLAVLCISVIPLVLMWAIDDKQLQETEEELMIQREKGKPSS